MLWIQCTKKLAEELQMSKTISKPEESHPLYAWHAHFFILNRRKSVLIMNNKTRYNFMLTGLKKTDFNNFSEIIIQGITDNLIADKINKTTVKQYIEQCGEITYASTSDRSVISQVNEMISTIKYWNEYDNFHGIEYDLYDLNRRLNQFIMLKFQGYPHERMRDELNQLDKTNELYRAEKEKQKIERTEAAKIKAESDIQQSQLSLQEALARLNKESLHQIRRNLHINQSSSLNKQELIEVLNEQIPSKVLEQLLMWDDERYQLVRKALDNEGFILTTNLKERQLEYFQDRGLLFLESKKGKKLLRMPKEIMDKCNEIQEKSIKPTIRKNTDWIKLTRGMLYYYGTLSVDQLKSNLRTFMGTKMDYDFISILEESAAYDGVIMLDEYGISDFRVFSSEQVLQEHQLRSELKFHPFSKAQLLLAGEPEFVDRDKAFQQFVEYLIKDFAMSSSEADRIAADSVYAVRLGQSPSDIMTYLQIHLEFNDMDQIQKLMGQLSYLMNHTRQWFLKGHAPSELSGKTMKPRNFLAMDISNNKETINARSNNGSKDKSNVIDFQTRKTIGRNDPCPCGSGVKFKKCCGK